MRRESHASSAERWPSESPLSHHVVQALEKILRRSLAWACASWCRPPSRSRSPSSSAASA